MNNKLRYKVKTASDISSGKFRDVADDWNDDLDEAVDGVFTNAVHATGSRIVKVVVTDADGFTYTYKESK